MQSLCIEKVEKNQTKKMWRKKQMPNRRERHIIDSAYCQELGLKGEKKGFPCSGCNNNIAIYDIQATI